MKDRLPEAQAMEGDGGPHNGDGREAAKARLQQQLNHLQHSLEDESKAREFAVARLQRLESELAREQRVASTHATEWACQQQQTEEALARVEGELETHRHDLQQLEFELDRERRRALLVDGERKRLAEFLNFALGKQEETRAEYSQRVAELEGQLEKAYRRAEQYSERLGTERERGDAAQGDLRRAEEQASRQLGKLRGQCRDQEQRIKKLERELHFARAQAQEARELLNAEQQRASETAVSLSNSCDAADALSQEALTELEQAQHQSAQVAHLLELERQLSAELQAKLEDERGYANRRMRELLGALEAERVRADLGAAKKDVEQERAQDAEGQVEQLQLQLDRLRAERECTKARSFQLEKEADHARARWQDSQVALDTLRRQAGEQAAGLASEQQELQAQMQALQAQLEQEQRQAEESEQQLARVRRRAEELEKTQRLSERGLAETRAQLQQHDGHLARQVEELNQELAQVRQAADQHRLRFEGEQEQVLLLNEGIERLTRKLDRREGRLREKQAAYDALQRATDERLSRLAHERDVAEAKLQDLQAALAEAQRRSSDHTASLVEESKVSDDLAQTVLEELELEQQRVRDADAERQRARRRLAEAEAEGKALREALEGAQLQLEDVRRQARGEVLAKEHELAQVTTLAEQLELRFKAEKERADEAVLDVTSSRRRLNQVSGEAAGARRKARASYEKLAAQCAACRDEAGQLREQLADANALVQLALAEAGEPGMAELVQALTATRRSLSLVELARLQHEGELEEHLQAQQQQLREALQSERSQVQQTRLQLNAVRSQAEEQIDALEKERDEAEGTATAARVQLERVQQEADARIARVLDSVQERLDSQGGELLEELESLAAVVARDLERPHRVIASLCRGVQDQWQELLDDDGHRWLGHIQRYGDELGRLIDDLSALARAARREVSREKVDLAQLARTVATRLEGPSTGVRRALGPQVTIASSLETLGDAELLEDLLDALFRLVGPGSSAGARGQISLVGEETGGGQIFCLRQRGGEFAFAGMGLSSPAGGEGRKSEMPFASGVLMGKALRVIRRHGGRAWTEPDTEAGGGSLYFTLQPE
jgi:chromosome segregation ATPase